MVQQILNKNVFNEFLKSYSKNVDNADNLYFWKLSDLIIEKLIRNYIPKGVKAGSTILDAGGGTGRWVVKLGKVYKKCNFILYDLSWDMLNKAAINIKNARMEDRAKLLKGDLCDIKMLKTGSVDYIISIYNPISFIPAKERAISELYRTLRMNGILIIMGQGYYNAISSKINNGMASVNELSNIERSFTIKWNPYVPMLNVFSQESMEKMLKKRGFSILKTFGIPVFVQPGPEDFDPTNMSKSKISESLEKSTPLFKKILELEMKYNGLMGMVNRGMNILCVAKK